VEHRFRTGKRKDGGTGAGTAWQTARLLLCLVILGAVLTLRSIHPEETKAFLNQYIVTGMDYTQVLAAAGDSLRSFFSLAPRPEDLPNPSADAEGRVGDPPTEGGATEGDTG